MWRSKASVGKDGQTIQLFLNCKNDIVDRIGEKKIEKDQLLIHIGQNMMEFIQPTEMSKSFQYILNIIENELDEQFEIDSDGVVGFVRFNNQIQALKQLNFADIQ